ncbi:MAG TPA: hypothetical protein PKZ56_02315, partial [Candidatus Paceibacterota bacterium]|nr:hypothetical protein [Candidatus Paceibacterota bacterium]
SIDTTSSGSDGIGGFINFIFQIGLGVAGVIGVVMLTVYGFQYAANDKNVQTFAQLKEKILGVVMGLLLLLGIFVILKTINPDLLIVEPEIPEVPFAVEDRASDPEFIKSIESIDGSNISTSLARIEPPMLMYLLHQQGPSGGMAIIWAAKKGYSSVPTNNPFTRSDINRNMRNNIGSDFKKLTGSSIVTPASFLLYWQKKILAFQADPKLAAQNVEEALRQASGKTGLDQKVLRAVCKIESAGCKPEKSNGSYKGLFQLSNDVFRLYVKNGDIFDPYHNSFAGASYGRDNLAFANKYWSKLDK